MQCSGSELQDVSCWGRQCLLDTVWTSPSHPNERAAAPPLEYGGAVAGLCPRGRAGPGPPLLRWRSTPAWHTLQHIPPAHPPLPQQGRRDPGNGREEWESRSLIWMGGQPSLVPPWSGAAESDAVWTSVGLSSEVCVRCRVMVVLCVILCLFVLCLCSSGKFFFSNLRQMCNGVRTSLITCPLPFDG